RTAWAEATATNPPWSPWPEAGWTSSAEVANRTKAPTPARHVFRPGVPTRSLMGPKPKDGRSGLLSRERRYCPLRETILGLAARRGRNHEGGTPSGLTPATGAALAISQAQPI